MKTLVVVCILIFTSVSYGFPHMVRHGYTSCTSCHVAPRGGNMMTQYGRAMSKELLSTWSYEGEEQVHYGAFDKTPDWFRIGGDFRAAQVHNRTEQVTIGRFIEMQEQIEVAAKYNSTWLNITGSSDTLQESRPWSISRFYLMTQVNDQINVRVGRFIPRFGVNTPEHILSTRGPVGFGFQTERDTLELTYTDEKWDYSLALTRGQLANDSKSSGVYSQFNYSFGNHDRFGLSYEQKSEGDKASALGIHGIVGLSKKFYLVSDTVRRYSESTGGQSKTGLFHFTKLGFEMEKGIHILLIGDLRKDDLSQNELASRLFGLGMTLYPRPHFEVQGIFAKRKRPSLSDQDEDYAWMMFHFYL